VNCFTILVEILSCDGMWLVDCLLTPLSVVGLFIFWQRRYWYLWVFIVCLLFLDVSYNLFWYF